MKTSFLVTVFGATCLGLVAQGIVPRVRATDYPVWKEAAGFTIGAFLLDQELLDRRFVSDLGEQFAVVEIAIYPTGGQSPQLHLQQFKLRTQPRDTVFPAESPEVAALVLQKAEEERLSVSVAPEVEVGYSSGSPPYWDPTYGPNRPYPLRKGPYVATRVGVLLEPTGDNSGGKNLEVRAQELKDKALPVGAAATPVAGHLYFRLDEATLKDPSLPLFLEAQVSGESVSLELRR